MKSLFIIVLAFTFLSACSGGSQPLNFANEDELTSQLSSLVGCEWQDQWQAEVKWCTTPDWEKITGFGSISSSEKKSLAQNVYFAYTIKRLGDNSDAGWQWGRDISGVVVAWSNLTKDQKSSLAQSISFTLEDLEQVSREGDGKIVSDNYAAFAERDLLGYLIGQGPSDTRAVRIRAR